MSSDVLAALQEQLNKTNVTAKVTLKGGVRTREVAAKGRETAVELTINQSDIAQIGEKSPLLPDVPPLPSGTVLIAKRSVQGWAFSTPNNEPMPTVGIMPLADLIADDFIGWQDFESDHLVGTARSQPVGGTCGHSAVLRPSATRLKNQTTRWFVAKVGLLLTLR